jgi:hypothetical protein
MAPVNKAMNLWILYMWVVPNPLSGNEFHKKGSQLQVGNVALRLLSASPRNAIKVPSVPTK